MSRCWSMLNNHRGRGSRPAASHGHVPNPTGPDVDTPSGGGEVPESARSRTDRPGRSAGAREALRAIPNTKRPARTRQKKTTKTTGHRNGGERRRTQEAPAEEAAHRGLNSCQSFLGRTLIQRFYICEDSQTTASWSATTGGCPPMLKLFMIGNQNQNQICPGGASRVTSHGAARPVRKATFVDSASATGTAAVFSVAVCFRCASPFFTVCVVKKHDCRSL